MREDQKGEKSDSINSIYRCCSVERAQQNCKLRIPTKPTIFLKTNHLILYLQFFQGGWSFQEVPAEEPKPEDPKPVEPTPAENKTEPATETP